jgi:hypothetical protein
MVVKSPRPLLDFIFVLLFVVQEALRQSPRPNTSPLVSGIAPPAEGQTNPPLSERPLSESQLNGLEAWLRLHPKRWRRSFIPPAGPSYMVLVKHSDGTGTSVYFFLRERFNAYFSKRDKNRRFDAGWLSLPVDEIRDLIAMLRRVE